MTREEKIRICIMLVDGHSFREIGDEMGYSHETIRSAAREIMSGMKQKCQCVFPRINQYMEVEGRIEAVTLIEGTAFICNEEGRLLGMKPNIIINEVGFVGPLLVVGVQGEHFSELPQAERWAKMLNA